MGLLDEWGQFGFGSLSGVFIPDGREVMFSPCYMTSGIFPSDLEFGSREFQKPKQLNLLSAIVYKTPQRINA